MSSEILSTSTLLPNLCLYIFNGVHANGERVNPYLYITNRGGVSFTLSTPVEPETAQAFRQMANDIDAYFAAWEQHKAVGAVGAA